MRAHAHLHGTHVDTQTHAQVEHKAETLAMDPDRSEHGDRLSEEERRKAKEAWEKECGKGGK